MRCLERGFVVWLTGLPASGKTTIALLAAAQLREAGIRTEVLDGDWVRKTINTDAGFTREERRRHLIRVAWIARLLARNGVAVLAAFVSPYRDVRAEVRKIVEEEVPFVEVYVKVSLEEAIRRDPKGLYKKALAGEIKNFTGIDDPYEEPENPDLILDNEKVPAEQNAERLIQYLAKRGLYEGPPQPLRAAGVQRRGL
ncbi:adenylyl-sulfate kinase [Pyrobaculum arsenaticum]|uniref:Adenylyl-sulfate kinase n=2 Tax=Pyrobaculum arsenaticum TaxID=121277 RepID=A4WHT8_PYRAR|nr:adenylyl-sulfate kinase [Pyrobaculum arsenaticum]ABP49955.1 adenylylsulfate kinase [Pyrobaculum arsenaticum DSM 13514]NYR16630.1 adenylyl-sulfate kinase [Pyrobaculum arsenaticum]